MLPRVFEELWDRSQDRPDGTTVTLRVSFMELYNEEIRDLLKQGNDHLSIREAENGSVYVAGVYEEPVASAQDMFQSLMKGSLNRSTGATNMNVVSSRSHAIFSLILEQEASLVPADGSNAENHSIPEGGSVLTKTVISRLNFVDLAGSERIKRTKAEGQRLKEGININSGLLALGNVISALGDEKRKATHVPYRDSKLTRILQDSLGGNSHTLMIACVSPSDTNFEETLNTLKYANRAKNIKNRPVLQVDAQTQLIEDLRKEVLNLRNQLSAFTGGNVPDFTAVDKMQQRVATLEYENELLSSALKKEQRKVNLLSVKLAKVSGIESDSTDMVSEVTMGGAAEGGEADTQPSKQDPLTLLQQQLNEKDRIIISLKAGLKAGRALGTATAQWQASVDGDTDRDVSDVALGNVEDILAEDDVEDMTEVLQDQFAAEKEFIQSHATMTKELTSIDRNILEKEDLMNGVSKNVEKFGGMKKRYESELRRLEDEVHTLERERAALQGRLESKENKTEEETARLKKKYNETVRSLRVQIDSYRKQEGDYHRLLRQIRQIDRKREDLKQEVISMKRSKVEIQKKMEQQAKQREEQRQSMLHEIMQMKKQMRKFQLSNEDLRAKLLQKEAVLSRRTEELHAIQRKNRGQGDGQYRSSSSSSVVRSTSADLERSKQAGRGKENSQSQASVYTTKSQKSWLEDVLSRRLQRNEAHENLERSLGKRETLVTDLNDLRERRDDLKNSDVENKENLLTELDNEIESNESTIDFLSEQIADVEKVLAEMDDSDEVTIKLRQMTATEAKGMLKYAVDVCLRGRENVRKKKWKMETTRKELTDLGATNRTLQDAVLDLERKLTQEKRQHEQNMLFMFEQMDGSSNTTDIAGGNNSSKDEVIPPIAVGMVSVREEHFQMLQKYREESEVTLRELKREVMQLKNENDELWQALEKAESAPSNTQPAPPPPKDSKTRPATEGKPAKAVPSNTAIPPPAKSRSSSTSSQREKEHEKPEDTISVSSVVGGSVVTTVMPLAEREKEREREKEKEREREREKEREMRKSPAESDGPPSGTSTSDVFSRLSNARKEPGSGLYLGVSKASRKADVINDVGEEMPDPEVLAEKPTHRLTWHEGFVLDVKVYGDHLYSASQDKTIMRIDLNTMKSVDRYTGHRGFVRSIVRSEPLGFLFSGSQDRTVKVWDVNTKSCVRALQTGSEVYTVNCEGNYLYAGCDNSVKIWDVRTMKVAHTLTAPFKGSVFALGLSSLYLFTGSRDHSINAFRKDTFEYVDTLAPPHFDCVNAFAVVDDLLLFSGSRDKSVKQWDIRNGADSDPKLPLENRFIQSRERKNAHKDWVNSVLVHNNILYTGSRDGSIGCWDVVNCSHYGYLVDHSASVNMLTSVGNHLISASNDRYICIWPAFEPVS